ncbi:MAG: di-trans,poly-cis-decaprenylcistransferase, partial [Campylobacterales bacterium]|nr:di-trans,poly-cis-decaprenylcistransferase [Campylobacterales bacterium]
HDTQEATKDNSKLTQILALNYGARAEIVDAVNRALVDGQEINEQSIGEYLQTPYTDIDLLIRTSGELRISNYLLWQLSYSELYFTPTLWPDFTPQELDEIIANFEGRERRFGGV